MSDPLAPTLPSDRRRVPRSGISMEMVRGIIRPALTMLLVGAFVWGFVVGRIDANVFVPTVASALSYWFASREATKRSGG